MQSFEYFTLLPDELQTEILKSNPSYPTIRTKYDKHMFYEQFCNLPISIHELQQYINTKPEKMIIYTTAIDSYNRPIFSAYVFSIADHVICVFKYYIRVNVNKITEQKYDLYFSNLNDFLRVIRYNSLYYDIYTTFNILASRQCQRINPNYATQKTLGIFNDTILDTVLDTDLLSCQDFCRKTLYLNTNYTLNDQEFATIGSYIQIIEFNKNGKMIDDFDFFIKSNVENNKITKNDLIHAIQYMHYFK